MTNNQFCHNKVCYFFDPPFISASDKLELNQVPCLFCAVNIYCSLSCRDQDWNKVHNQKCLSNPENQTTDVLSHQGDSLQDSPDTLPSPSRSQQQIHPIQIKYPINDVQDRFLHDFEEMNQVIGQGSYGQVVLVKDIHNSTIYAMKIIQKGSLQGMTQVQLNKEITIQKKLSHINVLKLFYSFQDRDFAHLILENAQNGSIRSIIDQQQGEDVIWDYFRQICLGINYLHSFNIIHRDLKPENILINDENIIKLCDFGWSTEVHGPSQTRDTICGTIDYMAPEMVVQKGGYGPQVDIWSLGIVLYELLNGQVPFKNGYDSSQGDLQMVNQSVSVEARQLLQSLLDIDPQKRFTLQDIFVDPWFKMMAKKSNFDLQTLSNELTQQECPIKKEAMSYFNIDNEAPDSEKQSARNTNISMICLDDFFNSQSINNMNLFNQFSSDLKKEQNQIEIYDDTEMMVLKSKKSDSFHIQPRKSRVVTRNNLLRIEEEKNSEQFQAKSLKDKFLDMFSCVKRETKLT